jgi:hypothetical protein
LFVCGACGNDVVSCYEVDHTFRDAAAIAMDAASLIAIAVEAAKGADMMAEFFANA